MNSKLISIFLVIVLILNLIFFALGTINQLWFWIVIIAIGVVAYKVLPKLK